MGRNATIHIHNNTGRWLYHVSDNIVHGKFQDDWSPPSIIKEGETGTFKVGNRTGAKIGPKGSTKYKLGYAPGISVNLIFYWDHPFGHTSSSYELGSDPPWFGSYYLNPPNPTGHDQTVTFETYLNDYAFDPKEWMATIGRLKRDLRLADMFIPGSHDSGTYAVHTGSGITLDYEGWITDYADCFGYASDWAKTQSNSIADQLSSGIRYLDLRFSNGIFVTGPITGKQFVTIGPNDPTPINESNVVRSAVMVCHTLAGTNPETVFSDIKTFIDKHPKEIVFLNCQHFYNFSDVEYKEIIQQMKDAFGSRLVTRQAIDGITLGALQDNGKQVIVFFDKDHKVIKAGEPEGGVLFKKVYQDLYDSNDFIWDASDNLYNDYPDLSRVTDLDIHLLKNIPDRNDPDYTLKFYVMQGILTPDKSLNPLSDVSYLNSISGKYPKSTEELGDMVSPQVISWVNNDWCKRPLNIIMLDWVCNTVITQICYMIERYKSDPKKAAITEAHSME